MRVASLLPLFVVASAVAFGCAGDDAEETPTATRTYDPDTAVGVSVSFKLGETSSSDLEDVLAYLRGLDPEMAFIAEESDPPIYHAQLRSASDISCEIVRAELEARPYVRLVECMEGPPVTPFPS